MENQEKTEEAIKNGESRENRRGNQEWRIKRKPKKQSRMDNQEKIEEAIKNGQSRENRRDNQEWTRENRRSNQVWTIKRIAILCIQEKEKKPHNTRCVGHHYVEANTNIVNKI
jgi:hypothetical protein